MNKIEFRKEALKRRDSLSKEYITKGSFSICDKLINLPEFKSSENILCYASYKSEVITYDIIERCLKLNKNVFLPKVKGDEIVFIKIKALSDLQPGYRNIPEPKGDTPANENELSNALVLVPGTSFDKLLNRNGYGGGYYDRFIQKHNPKYKIGLGFECQIYDKIITEPHDKKLDYIISEVNIYGK